MVDEGGDGAAKRNLALGGEEVTAVPMVQGTDRPERLAEQLRNASSVSPLPSRAS